MPARVKWSACWPIHKPQPCNRKRSFSTPELEVMRLCLPAGKQVPPHAVAGPITLLCLQGQIEVQAHGGWQPMRANDHLYLAGQVEHALRALTDAVVLVNIQRRAASAAERKQTSPD